MSLKTGPPSPKNLFMPGPRPPVDREQRNTGCGRAVHGRKKHGYTTGYRTTGLRHTDRRCEYRDSRFSSSPDDSSPGGPATGFSSTLPQWRGPARSVVRSETVL
jgi:hypothetical protein